MVVINDAERKTLTRDIQNEMLGFGPLETLLEDPTVSDILVNTYKQVYVERRGKLELTDVTFTDNAHLMKIIDKIVSRVGRRIDESSPDGRRAPARRLARECHHSAAGDRRSGDVDPAFFPPTRCAWPTWWRTAA